jgi:hypothetical protein
MSDYQRLKEDCSIELFPSPTRLHPDKQKTHITCTLRTITRKTLEDSYSARMYKRENTGKAIYEPLERIFGTGRSRKIIDSLQ